MHCILIEESGDKENEIRCPALPSEVKRKKVLKGMFCVTCLPS